MVKSKKPFDFKNPLVWGSAVVSIGIVFTFLTKTVDFFRLPDALAATNEKVSKLEESTKQIADVLTKQQVINDYINAKEKKADKEPVLSPDGKFIWNDETKKWERVR